MAYAIFLLYRQKDVFGKTVFNCLIVSIVLTITSELALTFYVSVYGTLNLIGHFFKIFSFYFIYKAIIISGLKDPYGLLFKELHQSEYRLKYAEKIAKLGHWEMDIATGKSIWSDEFFRICGIAPQSIEPTADIGFQLIHPEDREKASEIIQSAIENQSEYDIEKRIVRPDNTIRTVQSKGVVITENGQTKKLVGTFHDITDLKKAVKALKQSEEMYRLLADNISDVIWILDTENLKFRYVSPSVEKLLGYTTEEILNMDIKVLFTESSFKYFNSVASERRERFKQGHKEVFKDQYKQIHKDGHIVEVEVHARYTMNPGNNNVEAIGVSRDISNRKRLENKLIQQHKIEAIGTLAGGIAHDFNNILGIISGNISYALSLMDQDNEIYEALIDVKEGNIQAHTLTKQLLTFAKGGAPVKQTEDINQLIQKSANFVTRGSNVKCYFEFDEDLWAVDVDSGQISQTINNLVINANQAMPKGGKILIRSENIEIKKTDTLPLPSGNYVKISIKDQGIGIAEKNIDNIFDPYFSTKQKGKGLGLATTYSIIKNHGGHIHVKSRVEQGTTFMIYLPASKMDRIQIEDAQQIMNNNSQYKILIMDDEEYILNMTERLFTKMGHELTVSKDGDQAVKLYQEAHELNKPFDLVILDLTISGGMGGEETIKVLQQIDPEVKAIVSSGYSNNPVMANYKANGFQGVLLKPYLKYEVVKVLKEIFDEKI